MTKAEKLKMLEMRLDGMTIRQIADAMGVTYQYVQQQFEHIKKYRRKDFACVFPGLKQWMKENAFYIMDFSDLLGVCYQTILRKLRDEKGGFTLLEIKTILARTGLTFEEAFGEQVELPRSGGESDD